MPTINDVFEFLDSFAPVGTKMEFDNVGFLVGFGKSPAHKILVSLDITNDVISEALDIGANLIVSHHPLFFSLKSVSDTDPVGEKIVRLLSGGVSAICMHTNLDAARGGVNDALAAAVGLVGADGSISAELLSEDGCLPTGEAFSYGRYGYLRSPCNMPEYLTMLKKALNTNGLRYYDAGRDVYKVAVVGGSGGDMFDHVVRNGCDTFVSADIKYHVFLQAKELGINLIDGDHFCTENVVTGVLVSKLRAAFPVAQVMVSDRLTQTVKFC